MLYFIAVSIDITAATMADKELYRKDKNIQVWD